MGGGKLFRWRFTFALLFSLFFLPFFSLFFVFFFFCTQIQAALPNGARLRARGRFESHMVQRWISFVENASTAVQLMEAWLLLETSINPRWLEPGYIR